VTERKPPGIEFETWVDRQIREAEQRGAFKDLPGAGSPLEGLDRPYDETWWLKEKMAREGLSYLPPALALRKAVEDGLEQASRAPSEAAVRRLLEPLNERIAEALRRPPPGPPLGRGPVDVEAFLEDWRARRAG
jgi:hypothetical protein